MKTHGVSTSCSDGVSVASVSTCSAVVDSPSAVRLDGRSVDVYPIPGPIEFRFKELAVSPSLTSRERHEPWTAFVRAVLTEVVTSDEHDFNTS